MGTTPSALAIVAHELFGNGLKDALNPGSKHEPVVRMEVLTDLRSALEFEEEDALSPIRLVVVDTDASMVTGKGSLDALRRRFPKASIVVATAPLGRAGMLEILGWGAHGLILMTQTAQEIRHAISVVLRGGIFVPQVVGAPPVVASGPAVHRVAPDAAGRFDLQLSLRQSEVLALLTEGLSNKAIARELDLAEATVKVHVNAIYRALNVHNRASAVAAVLARRMPVPAAQPAPAQRSCDEGRQRTRDISLVRES